MWRFRDSEDGISAVLVALSLTVILGLAAVTIDGGNLYQERRDAQNAADQAALAAAYYECNGGSTSDAIQAGLDAAANNGFADSDPDITVSVSQVNSNEYQAVITSNLDTSFGQLLGHSTVGTNGSAVVSCVTDGGGTGTTLHANAPDHCSGDELLIDADDVHVDGGTHANGDISVTGDAVEMYDGTTYGGSWSASADDEDVDPEQVYDPVTRDYPITYDLDDYDSGGYFDNSSNLHPDLYTYHGSDTTFTNSIDAGIHFVAGTVEIHGGDEDNPFQVDEVMGYDGVTIVATGPIELYSDWLELSAFDYTNNYGLLLFSNYGEGIGDECFDGTAIDTLSDHPSYDGVIYAPYGRANVLSDGASAAAIWANFVNLTGNEDDGIHLSYPSGAVTTPNYEMEFQQ